MVCQFKISLAIGRKEQPLSLIITITSYHGAIGAVDKHTWQLYSLYRFWFFSSYSKLEIFNFDLRFFLSILYICLKIDTVANFRTWHYYRQYAIHGCKNTYVTGERFTFISDINCCRICLRILWNFLEISEQK